MSDDRTPTESLTVLLDAAWQERTIQLAAVDGLDAKSGVILGFAGAIIALTTSLPELWMRLIVVVILLISAGCAGWSLRVKSIAVIEAPPLRDRYLTRSLPDTQLAILDTLVHQQPALKSVIETKARWTRYALSALALGVLAMAVLVVVFG